MYLALLSLFLLILSACSEKYRLIEEALLEEGANIRINNFQRQFTDKKGDRTRSLQAKDAYIYTQAGFGETKVIFYDFTFYQYESKGRLLYTIRGGRGELDSWDQWLFLQKGGYFQDEKGNIIETESLRYNISDEILESREPVTIQSASTLTVCLEGVRIDRKKGSQLCRKPQFQGRFGGSKTPGLEEFFL